MANSDYYLVHWTGPQPANVGHLVGRSAFSMYLVSTAYGVSDFVMGKKEQAHKFSTAEEAWAATAKLHLDPLNVIVIPYVHTCYSEEDAQEEGGSFIPKERESFFTVRVQEYPEEYLQETSPIGLPPMGYCRIVTDVYDATRFPTEEAANAFCGERYRGEYTVQESQLQLVAIGESKAPLMYPALYNVDLTKAQYALVVYVTLLCVEYRGENWVSGWGVELHRRWHRNALKLADASKLNELSKEAGGWVTDPEEGYDSAIPYTGMFVVRDLYKWPEPQEDHETAG